MLSTPTSHSISRPMINFANFMGAPLFRCRWPYLLDLTEGVIYNLPQEREIAAILPGSNEHATIGCDLIVKLRLQNGVAAEQPQYECIWETNFNYTPLMYVLLFPHGQPGWGHGILLSNPGDQPGEGDAP